jgi:hypothetical protein
LPWSWPTGKRSAPSSLRHDWGPGSIIYRVIPVTVSADKITRANAAAPPVEAGNVYLPGRRVADVAAGYDAPAWVADFIEEAATFPNGRNDDQVDAFSQAINCARTHASINPARTYVPKGRIPDNLYALGLETPQEAALRHQRILNQELAYRRNR